MSRTKTPQQLNEQWTRVNKYIRERWGKEVWKNYCCGVYFRYSLNMGNYNGEHPYWTSQEGYYYNERNNAPVPVECYTKKI